MFQIKDFGAVAAHVPQEQLYGTHMQVVKKSFSFPLFPLPSCCLGICAKRSTTGHPILPKRYCNHGLEINFLPHTATATCLLLKYKRPFKLLSSTEANSSPTDYSHRSCYTNYNTQICLNPESLFLKLLAAQFCCRTIMKVSVKKNKIKIIH